MIPVPFDMSIWIFDNFLLSVSSWNLPALALENWYLETQISDPGLFIASGVSLLSVLLSAEKWKLSTCLSIYLYIYTRANTFVLFLCLYIGIHESFLTSPTIVQHHSIYSVFYPFNICNYPSPTTLNIYTYLIKPSQYNLSPLSLPPTVVVFIPLRVWHPSPSHHHNPQVDALFTLLRPSAPLWSTMTSHLLPMNAAAFFGFTWWLLDLIV